MPGPETCSSIGRPSAWRCGQRFAATLGVAFELPCVNSGGPLALRVQRAGKSSTADSEMLTKRTHVSVGISQSRRDAWPRDVFEHRKAFGLEMRATLRGNPGGCFRVALRQLGGTSHAAGSQGRKVFYRGFRDVDLADSRLGRDLTVEKGCLAPRRVRASEGLRPGDAG